MKNLMLIFMICIASTAMAQSLGLQTLEQLEESPAGSKIIKFIDLISSGEAINDEKINALFSKRLIDKFGAEGLAGILEDIRQNDGQLDLFVADRTEKFRYDLTMKSRMNGDWMACFLNLEQSPPYNIDGFGMENGKVPKADVDPIYSPQKDISFPVKPMATADLKDVAKSTDAIAQSFHDLGWFSGIVLCADKGKPYFQQTYGMADIEKGIKNTKDTKFRIGSINKDYTAVLILQEVQKGNLSLEDKLSKFDLGFSKKISDKITVRNLLNHSAGFGDIFIPEYLDNIREYKNIDDVLKLLLQAPLEYEPGTDQRYSNYGYIVLGAILEKTTGKKFNELLQENIHAMTGCKNTDYDIAENIKNEAQSYRFSVTGKKLNHTAMLEYPTPDGGMYATVNDLLDFFQTLFYTEKLLMDEYKVLMLNDFKESTMKWKDLLDNPRMAAGFAGGGPGVSAVVEFDFHKNHVIIVLANTDRGVAEELTHSIVAAYKNREYNSPKLPPANFIYQIYEKKGVDYLRENLKNELKKEGYRDYDSMLLNSAGYELMQEEKLNEAIDLFKLNTQLFPNEANPYDSLGEAYLNLGDKENAKKYYKKALEVDPEFPSAKRALKNL